MYHCRKFDILLTFLSLIFHIMGKVLFILSSFGAKCKHYYILFFIAKMVPKHQIAWQTEIMLQTVLKWKGIFFGLAFRLKVNAWVYFPEHHCMYVFSCISYSLGSRPSIHSHTHQLPSYDINMICYSWFGAEIRRCNRFRVSVYLKCSLNYQLFWWLSHLLAWEHHGNPDLLFLKNKYKGNIELRFNSFWFFVKSRYVKCF